MMILKEIKLFIHAVWMMDLDILMIELLQILDMIWILRWWMMVQILGLVMNFIKPLYQHWVFDEIYFKVFFLLITMN